jgi:Iron-sulfur cluster-binding domain
MSPQSTYITNTSTNSKSEEEFIQEPPFAIQVEFVEGCNLRCSFCGLNGIRGKENNLKFMHSDTVEVICDGISEANWNSRIEFAMHGEPTLHPSLIPIVDDFRTRLPRHHLMMTSNGGGLLKDPTRLVDALLENLNVLALDNYENVNIVSKIIASYKGIHTPIQYPSDRRGNPHRKRKYTEHDLVVVQDISNAAKGTHSSINNHCGAGAPLNNEAEGKRCAKPFREMSIRWDGSIAICCNDWRGVYKIGNVNQTKIYDLWQHPRLQAARRFLYHGQRSFTPCLGCDAISYRPGLLPDHMGKVELPLPTKEDQAIVDQALAGKPYTLPVLRSWEH